MMNCKITQTIKPVCIALVVGLMGSTAMNSQAASSLSERSEIIPVVEETITVSQNYRLPQHDENGNYRRSPHKIWKVVDADPNGLNCRMTSMSYRELIDPRNDVEFDIVNWPVVGTLRREQQFRIDLGPAGMGMMYDTRQQPWIFVNQTLNGNSVTQCFVRANNRFVQPVAD
ncbi:MAG: hypothetical protein WBA13_01515 [Microcoleaceae cyanobacterium]